MPSSFCTPESPEPYIALIGELPRSDTRRRRPSTSAGEADATTTSAMPHCELTTVNPPSVRMSTIGVESPEAWIRRHSVFAVAKSSRASRKRMVLSGIFTRLAASIGSTRTR